MCDAWCDVCVCMYVCACVCVCAVYNQCGCVSMVVGPVKGNTEFGVVLS